MLFHHTHNTKHTCELPVKWMGLASTSSALQLCFAECRRCMSLFTYLCGRQQQMSRILHGSRPKNSDDKCHRITSRSVWIRTSCDSTSGEALGPPFGRDPRVIVVAPCNMFLKCSSAGGWSRFGSHLCLHPGEGGVANRHLHQK